MITISGKTLGQRKPLFADWSIPFPPELKSPGDNVTLRSLIEKIVRNEVSSFNQRQKDNQVLRALTSKQISEGAAKGKIDMGGRDHEAQHADADQAVATAMEAFQDGLFLVVVDEDEKRNLDQQLFLKPDSRVTFIRLTLLAGG
jgi:hypothetical protein